MSLSCTCGDYRDDGQWYEVTEEYSPLKTSKRKRCCSCRGLMDVGAPVLSFFRWRNCRDDIEESIHGDEVPLAPFYMCESCGDQFMNLEALGYCIDITQNMFDLLAEYAEMRKAS